MVYRSGFCSCHEKMFNQRGYLVRTLAILARKSVSLEVSMGWFETGDVNTKAATKAATASHDQDHGGQPTSPNLLWHLRNQIKRMQLVSTLRRANQSDFSECQCDCEVLMWKKYKMVANKMCNVNLNVVQRKSSQTIINHQRKLTIHFQVSDTVAVNIHKGVVDMKRHPTYLRAQHIFRCVGSGIPD